MSCRPAVTLLSLLLCTGASALAAPDLETLLPTPVLLLGEQHDAPEHQALQKDTVLALAARGQLAALVLEMADTGRSTGGLAQDADETRVREALAWSGEGTGQWPWPVYAPVVMAAVRAGVPVLGGNLPRSSMRTAMADTSLDAALPETGLSQQRENIRQGHCDLLPEAQIAPMTRIQLARDRSMAATVQAARVPGRTVLLVAGNQHVRADLGVPQHLGAGVPHKVVMAQAGPAAMDGTADQVWRTAATAPRDHCAELRRSMGR